MRRLPEKINGRGGRQENGGRKAFCTKPQFKTFLLSTTFQIEDYTLEGPWNIRFFGNKLPLFEILLHIRYKKRLDS